MCEFEAKILKALILLGVALTRDCENHLIYLLSSNKFAKVVQSTI